jgi:hypothetical protein
MRKFEKELNSVRGLCMTCCILTGHMERKEASYTKLCRIHGLSAMVVHPDDRKGRE